MVKAEMNNSGADNPVVSALVHKYLEGIDAKLAKSYKTKVGKDLPDLPKEMPALPEMVASYQVMKSDPLTLTFVGL